MPELPDVQVLKEYLENRALRRRIADVEVTAPEMLAETSTRELKSRLKGARLVDARRHGKYLFALIDHGGWLLLHFGMTGDLEYGKDELPPDHVRLRLDFADGSHLAFRDIRKFGRFGLVDDVDAYVREHRLGPDPTDPSFALPLFRKAIQGRKTAVKSVFLDQHALAGIGNVYADEILFQARVHPETSAAELDDRTIRALFRSTQRVLRAAVTADADPSRMPRSFLLPRRYEGGHCPRCGSELRKVKVGGRPTYFCPVDQKKSNGK